LNDFWTVEPGATRATQEVSQTTPLSRWRKGAPGLALILCLFLYADQARGWTLTPLTNVIVCPGDNAYFSTVASGPKPYFFQWWKNGVKIPHPTNDSLTLSNVTMVDASTYSIVFLGQAVFATLGVSYSF
jgi:hypothetical protein